MSRGRVLVIGGGLAGVTAALDCADRGFEVTVLESRPRLGGATYSFHRGNLVVDTGQHVFLRCYTAYLDVLRRLGVSDAASLQERFRVPVLTPNGRNSLLWRTKSPPPAHLTPALLGHRELTPAQRAGAVRTAWALRRLDPDDPSLDEISFGEWLQARGVPERAVDVLWGLFAIAALNAEPDQAALGLAVKVFRTGLLETTDGGDIGVLRRSLGEVHDSAAYQALTAAGVEVRLRSKALGVHVGDSGFRVPIQETTVDTPCLDADAIVVAVPHRAAATLLEDVLPEAGDWWRLGSSPIVNVHVVYDRPITAQSMAAVIDSPVQWVFDRTWVAGLNRGQYLTISLSAADEYLHVRTDRIRELFLPELSKIFPRAQRASVRDFFVTREPQATFLQAPGTRALRPPAATGIPGVVLAGAWTATGWPDTLEGAVRSGHRAAEEVALRSTDRIVARR